MVVCGDCVVVEYTGRLAGLSSGAKKFGGGGKTIPGTRGPGGTSVELSVG